MFRARNIWLQRDASQVIAHFGQSGLGLPDRDYYLAQDERSKALRETYQQHVKRMLGLIGMAEDEATKAAHDVLYLETRLAKVAKTRVEMRDVHGLYNRIDRAGIGADNLYFDAEIAQMFGKPQSVRRTAPHFEATSHQQNFQWQFVHKRPESREQPSTADWSSAERRAVVLRIESLEPEKTEKHLSGCPLSTLWLRPIGRVRNPDT